MPMGTRLRGLIRAIRGTPAPLEVSERVVSDTYVRDGNAVEPADPQAVAAGAGILESALAMTDELPPEATINLSFTRKELAAFVCYMRQLDSAYREQGEFISRHIKVSYPDGHPYELEGVEETAKVSPERYAELTGRSPR